MRIGLRLLSLGLLFLVQAAWGQYELIDLGTRGASTFSLPSAYAINELGQAVGKGGLFYDPVKGDTKIYLSDCLGINDFGQVVGYRNRFTRLGAIYDPESGTVEDISNTVSAIDINNSGQIVGNSSFYSSFFYDPTLGFVEIDTQGFEYEQVEAVNNNGLAVGYVRNAGATEFHSFMYSVTDGATDFSSALNNSTFNIAHAVNDSGLIVGRNGTAFTDCLPYTYDTQTSEYQTLYNADLNMVIGGAIGVNNVGQVVGFYATESSPENSELRPFFWDGDEMIDINTWLPEDCGWTMTFAYDINDSGWIVGTAIASDGTDHACLIRPVPEPGTMALVMLGVGMVTRRKMV